MRKVMVVLVLAAGFLAGCPGKDPVKECIKACPIEVLPICGMDGKNYDNACEAKCSGTTVNYDGECKAGG